MSDNLSLNDGCLYGVFLFLEPISPRPFLSIYAECGGGGVEIKERALVLNIYLIIKCVFYKLTYQFPSITDI